MTTNLRQTYDSLANARQIRRKASGDLFMSLWAATVRQCGLTPDEVGWADKEGRTVPEPADAVVWNPMADIIGEVGLKFTFDGEPLQDGDVRFIVKLQSYADRMGEVQLKINGEPVTKAGAVDALVNEIAKRLEKYIK
jgi:hypothetical protein